MRWQFEPEDEDAFGAARDELVSGFEATAVGAEVGWVAAQVLDFKWGYLDGDLGRWRPDEVEEILLELYPAKVMIDDEDIDTVPRAFAAFLRHLGREGVVAEAEPAAVRAEGLARRFRVEVTDPANWSFGKRLWGEAQAEGIDFSEPESLQAFMDDFNQRPFAERGAVLGGVGARREPGPAPVAGWPGHDELPPVAELEEVARSTVWCPRLQGLVAYVGPGRPVTDKGNLKLADGKALVEILGTDDPVDDRAGGRVVKTMSSTELGGVDLTYQIALEAGMLMLEGRRVVPGPNAGQAQDPLALLSLALPALLEVGPTQYRYRSHNFGWDWYAEDLDDELASLLIELYRRGPAPIDELANMFWAHLHDLYDLSDVPEEKLAFHRDLVGRSLLWALDVLAELGIVEVDGVIETPTAYGSTQWSGGVTRLAPLGTWALEGVVSGPPDDLRAGTLREATAADLLTAAADLPDAAGEAEIDTWIADHGPTAAAELVAALREASAIERGAGFRALLRIGPEAEGPVGTLADDPALAPFVTVWRIDTGLAGSATADCGGDPERFVVLLAAMIEVWGVEVAVNDWAAPMAGEEGLAPMLESSWRVRQPTTEMVLAAIAAEHRDKASAKAARKALFKRRSAH